MFPVLSIVMPVYNEAQALPIVIADWTSQVLDKIPGSCLIFVNDGSKDESGAILDRESRRDSRIHVIHKPNGGHGSAIMAGYGKAMALNAEWIAQTDSDGQFSADQFDLLWTRRDGAILIRGRRSHRTEPLHRKIGAFVERLVTFLIFGRIVFDPNCGFRLMRRSLLEKALGLISPEDVAPNFEISVIAATGDPRGVRTVLAKCGPRLFGVSSFPVQAYVRAGFHVIRDLLVLRMKL